MSPLTASASRQRPVWSALALLLAATTPLLGAEQPSGRDSTDRSTLSVAQAGAYEVDRYVIAAGGGVSSGGAFAVSGTLGQADADPLGPSSGGNYAVSGGYWGEAGNDRIFANGFELP